MRKVYQILAVAVNHAASLARIGGLQDETNMALTSYRDFGYNVCALKEKIPLNEEMHRVPHNAQFHGIAGSDGNASVFRNGRHLMYFRSKSMKLDMQIMKQ